MNINGMCVTVGLWLAFFPSLTAQTILVEFSDSGGYVFSDEEQAVIVEIAGATEAEVRESLPLLPWNYVA